VTFGSPFTARKHLDIFNLNNRRQYWFYIIKRNHDRTLPREPGFRSRTRDYSKLASCRQTTLYAATTVPLSHA